MLAVYALTAAGQFQTVDAAQELSVAVSIRDGRGVQSDFPRNPGGGTTEGRSGWSYAGHDIGSSLLYLPFTLVPGSTERVPPQVEKKGLPGVAGREAIGPSRRLYFAASFLPALLGALIVLAFAATIEELGFDPVTNAITSLLFAFTSTIWVYSHLSFDSTATALAIIAAVWGLVRFRKHPTHRHALFVGVALGAGLLMRSDTLIMIPFLLVPIAWTSGNEYGRDRRIAVTPTLMAMAPVVIAGCTNLAYNWYRFGSIFDNGHTDDGFLTPTLRLGDGFYGQVASPGKGLLVLSPIVIVALFRWRWFVVRHATIAVAIAGASLASLLAHSAIVGWAGDQAWGSRFTVPLVPILALPAARVVLEIRKRRARVATTVGTWLLLSAGFIIQLTGVLVDFFAVITARRLRGENTATDPNHLAYIDGLQVLFHALTRSQPYPGLTPKWIHDLHVARLDLWWVRAAQVSGWNLATIGIPLALIAVAAWAAYRLRSSLPRRVVSLDEADT